MKRMTKAQRERAQRAALLRRVADVVAGALGREYDADSEVLGGPELSRIVPALRDLFDPDGEDLKHLWIAWNLDRYIGVNEITDFLFDNGVRA